MGYQSFLSKVKLRPQLLILAIYRTINPVGQQLVWSTMEHCFDLARTDLLSSNLDDGMASLGVQLPFTAFVNLRSNYQKPYLEQLQPTSEATPAPAPAPARAPAPAPARAPAPVPTAHAYARAQAQSPCPSPRQRARQRPRPRPAHAQTQAQTFCAQHILD